MRFADVNARSTLVTGRATGIDPARAAGDESLAAPFGPVTIADDTVDWEAEVVVVIGRTAHRVPESEAWGHVAGITAGQDSETTVDGVGTTRHEARTRPLRPAAAGTATPRSGTER